MATDHQGTRADWTTEGGFAHQATAMIELRMNDLIKGARATLSAADSHANSPTLREITPAFSPVLIPGRTPTYAANPAQIISRVQHYTQARKSRDGLNLSHDLPKMGDPDVTPQAIFGLPWTLKKGVLRELLQFPRFGRVGLDAVIINLTGSERDLHRDDWEKALELLLEELPSAPGRRPPLILLCDDPYMHRRAEGLIKQASGKINRKFPSKLGIYAPLHMPVGDAVELPTVLPPLRVQADFKDPGLASLRAELLALANLHGGSGDREMARVTRKALDVLARTASLPLGLEEALAIAKVYYEEDTDENMRALALFLPGQDFQRMVAAATMIGRSIEQATNLRDQLQSRLASWQQDTPVSAKLWSLLANPKWNNADTAVAIGDPRIAEVFQLATRAVELRVRTISHHDLDRLTKSKRLIVLSPTPNSIHALLTMPHPLDEVVVIGDCAGVGKLSRLLKTLSELPSLGPIAARATALAKVFEIGGAYERLDEAEAKFRLGPDPSKELLDFSRGTGLNGGDVVVITTRGGDVIYHRKQAQVPVYLPDDIRPFNRGLREIVATSAVSHGVDVENFNAMAFAGLPSDIAEYIQASSRVGRTHVGFSILVPTPQVRRDRYVVEVHQSFHRLLERMIPPPAAERWAERAIIRSVPSLIQTWLAGVHYQKAFIAAPDAAKASTGLPERTAAVAAIMGNAANYDACIEFIASAFGVRRPANVGGSMNQAYYMRVIREQVRLFLNSVNAAACPMWEFWSMGLGDLPRPMTSLRDVQGQGTIRPTSMLPGRKLVEPQKIAVAMSNVRSGSTRARHGRELDADEVTEGRRPRPPRAG